MPPFLAASCEPALAASPLVLVLTLAVDLLDGPRFISEHVGDMDTWTELAGLVHLLVKGSERGGKEGVK